MMTSATFDLPRDWLTAPIDRLTKPELEGCIAQARAWGFTDGAPTTNLQRVEWLREARQKAWDILQPRDETHATVNPATRKGGGRKRARVPCDPGNEGAAAEANAFLRTLPPLPWGD